MDPTIFVVKGICVTFLSVLLYSLMLPERQRIEIGRDLGQGQQEPPVPPQSCDISAVSAEEGQGSSHAFGGGWRHKVCRGDLRER